MVFSRGLAFLRRAQTLPPGTTLALKSEDFWLNMKVKFSSLTLGLWVGLRAEPKLNLWALTPVCAQRATPTFFAYSSLLPNAFHLNVFFFLISLTPLRIEPKNACLF